MADVIGKHCGGRYENRRFVEAHDRKALPEKYGSYIISLPVHDSMFTVISKVDLCRSIKMSSSTELAVNVWMDKVLFDGFGSLPQSFIIVIMFATALRHVLAMSSLLGLSPKCSQLVRMWPISRVGGAPGQLLLSRYPTDVSPA